MEYGKKELKAHGIEDFDFDARQLLLTAADITPTRFLLEEDRSPAAGAEERYRSFIGRRCGGEPLQYIVGTWDFLDCTMKVGEGVLIPRPETEELARIAIEAVTKKGVTEVIDLCSGTGCIGISIAKACPQTHVVLLEKYAPAVEYCRANAELNGVKNVSVVQGDIFDGLPGGMKAPQLIVSNPPYIPSSELNGLQREVLFEPESALDGGSDGMTFYRAITDVWLPAAEPPTLCAVECGECESDEISRMFGKFGDVNVVYDVFGTDRFVCLNLSD